MTFLLEKEIRDASENKDDNFIWTQDGSKVLFQKYRACPTFVGNSVESDTKKESLMPILLWPEQKAHMIEQDKKNSLEEMDNKNDSNQSKKRGRDDDELETNNKEDGADEDHQSDDLASKKKRIKINERPTGIFQSVKSKLQKAVNWVYPIWFNPKKSNQSNNNSFDSSEINNNSNVSNNSNSDEIDKVDLQKVVVEEVVEEIIDNNANKTIEEASIINEIVDVPIIKKEVKTFQSIIYNSLKEIGYFIGPGDVYGGDYSLYKTGDPSNSHSIATVRVLRERKISVRDIIAFSRVQNQVAKSAILAYVPPSNEKGSYLIFNFKGVSERI
jgi:tRNA-intron lyase